MDSPFVPPSIAIGPSTCEWGARDWAGGSLVEALQGPFPVQTFQPWEVPVAEVVLVVKQPPPLGWVTEVVRRSAVIYCPVDHYADPEEIAAHAPWLRLCSRIAVHCRRLEAHFAPFAQTVYLDHPLRRATPTRRTFRPDGPLLWIGARGDLPALVAWVNGHPLPAPLDVLTDPEQTGHTLTAVELGFHPGREVRTHEWTPDRHRALTAVARAALDVKGDDFRSRHGPPAQALDFVASGLPLALNPGSSPAEHLAGLGLNVPSPHDVEQWLSERYWKEVRRLGERLSRDLAPARIARRVRKLVEAVLADRPSAPVVADTAPRAEGAERPSIPPSTAESPATIPVPPIAGSCVYGLMITKDDHPIFEDWCRSQLALYDAVVCLDGSAGTETARVAERFADRLVYLREGDFAIPHKTNHGLRHVVHREIVRRFGHGHWVMLCHPDEFCYHAPRKVAAKAEREGYDQVSWFSPHFYPHPDEWADWERLRRRPIPERHTHYHWSYRGDGFPWCEDRLYRDRAAVTWDDQTHGSTRPHGLTRSAPFHPILRHYKVLFTDPTWYDVGGGAACYRTHWCGLEHRAGLPFPVRQATDFFVRSVRNYARCDRFEGTFPHPWNMGEEFRPTANTGAVRQRYLEAKELAVRGEIERAEGLLRGIEGEAVEAPFRALVRSDLATLAAVQGRRGLARSGFVAALDLDPGCEPARLNLATLDEGPEESPPPAPPPPRPVRVAVVSLLFNWPSTGGGNIHSAELPAFLARAGYDVRHFYARFDPWRIGRVTAPTPHPAEPLEFGPAEWSAGGIVNRFRQAVDAFDPDWVVLTDSWNLKPLLADAAGGRPYVLRLQALECLCPLNNVRLIPGPDGRARQCPRHQLATPDACHRCLQTLGHTSGDLHRAERALAGVGTPGYHEALVRAFAGAAAVLAVNPLTAAMVEPYARDARVVTAGMDPGRFPWPHPSGWAATPTPGRLRILFAGLTGEWMKGFHVLRAACGRLWQSRRDFELVATDDPPPTGGDEFIRYIGWQSQSDLPRQMAGADVIAVPTVAQEALGRTAVEAMAAGRAVVASRIGGLSFTVADGATGLLCEPGDALDLADKVARLLDDAGLRERLGSAGRARFEEHFAWPVVVQKHYRPLFGDPTRTNI